MSFKTLVICSVIVYAQATKPDVLAKRDSSVEVDPYAAYYEAYSNQVQNQPLSHELSEKQGFAGAMENVLGDDAAVSFIKCRLKILSKFIIYSPPGLTIIYVISKC